MKRLWYSIWPFVMLVLISSVLIGTCGFLLHRHGILTEWWAHTVEDGMIIPIVIFFSCTKYDVDARWKSYKPEAQ